MRAKEFLKEASVFKKEKNQYVTGYRMSISTKNNGAAIKAIQSVIPDFSPDEELIIVDKTTKANAQVPLSKKTDASFKLQRPNEQVIELVGTESSIESSLNGLGPAVDANAPEQVKLPNQGDTAEALLGAAMFAKIRKREGNSIGPVTTDDIWEIFDKMKPTSADDYMVTSKDLGGATDTIWFRCKVKGFVKTALVNPAMRKRIDKRALSPVNYVNSDEGTAYSEEFYKNGRPDEIGIISDGISAQSERKSDVFTVVRDPKTGRVAKELLPISLKAGAEQFAQHSGSNWRAMEEMFAKIGVQFPPAAKKAYEEEQAVGAGKASGWFGFSGGTNMISATNDLYEKAAHIINSKLKTSKDEATFVQQINSALRFWATSDKDNVRIVSFGSRGSFEVLRFDQLVPAMSHLKLRATAIPGKNPTLTIGDAKEGMLFKIRTYVQEGKKGPYQRNVIEKGPLLSKVANAIAAPTPAPAQTPAPAPVAPVKSKPALNVNKNGTPTKFKPQTPEPTLPPIEEPAA